MIIFNEISPINKNILCEKKIEFRSDLDEQ